MIERPSIDHTSIALHWLVGIALLSLLAVGFYMTVAEVWALYPWHKSFGVLIFALVLLRAVRRLKQGWPAPAEHYSRLVQGVAKSVHWLLLLLSIALPLSGVAFSALSGHGVDLFGLRLIASNPSPTDPDDVLPLNTFWASASQQAHHLLGYALAACVVLHVLGALKHHLFDRDRTLLRMLGR
jgi:cytochrome b561